MMLSVMFTLLFAQVPVEPPADSPQGSPPLIVRAEVDRAGDLVSRQNVIQFVTEVRTRKIVVNGKEVPQQVEVSVPVMRELVQKWSLKEAKITTVAGKKIDRKELAKRLERPAAVVVSADGKAIDAGYLKLFKLDTIVIVVSAAKR
jgi:hypothetical protein